MPPFALDPDQDAARAVRWLRVLKLLLTVILLGIAVWNGLTGALPL